MDCRNAIRNGELPFGTAKSGPNLSICTCRRTPGKNNSTRDVVATAEPLPSLPVTKSQRNRRKRKINMNIFEPPPPLKFLATPLRRRRANLQQRSTSSTKVFCVLRAYYAAAVRGLKMLPNIYLTHPYFILSA